MLLHQRFQSLLIFVLVACFLAPVSNVIVNGRQLQSSSCPAPQDVIFVVDASGSMMKGKIFEDATAFVEGVIDGLVMPPAHAGVIRYEDEVKKVSDFDDNRTALKARIQQYLVFSDGETELGPPLAMAHDMFVGASANVGAARTVVIITDGNPNDWVATRNRANTLKAIDNARLMGVIFGDHRQSDEHLLVKEIVSDQDSSNNFVRVSDYTSISDVITFVLDTMYSPCACEIGLQTTLDVDRNTTDIMLEARLEYNTTRRAPCEQYLSQYSGWIDLQCRDGGNHTPFLLANHSCERTCPANDTTLVFSQNQQKNLTLPSSMKSSDVIQVECNSLFPDTVGDISVTCQNGVTRASSACVTDTMCPVEYPDVYLWVLISLLFLCLLSLTWVVIWICCKKKKSKVPAEMQTEPDCIDDAAQTFLETKSLQIQTDNWMFAELKSTGQLPLDIVFCVDSSTSVTEEGFGQAKNFLTTLVEHFECPTIQAGLIQFNDKHDPFPFIIPVTGDQAELLQQIQSMEYKIGETKMAPPLQESGKMLRDNERAVHKLVVLLTDGDPNDPNATFAVASKLKQRGARIVIVMIGPHIDYESMCSLATSPEHVYQLSSYSELSNAIEKILQMIIQVSNVVHRCKIAAPLNHLTYDVVPSIDEITGWEIMVDGWDFKRTWAPEKYPPMLDPSVLPWHRNKDDETLCISSQNTAVQTAVIQGESGVFVELQRGGQNELDIVFCIDSSSSVTAIGFNQAKSFVAQIVQHFECPAVQAGLIQFHDSDPFPLVIPMMEDHMDLVERIQNMEYQIGETKMAPPLYAAANMLEATKRSVNKAIFLLTDGDPNDYLATKEAAADLKSRGVRVIIVMVGPHVGYQLMCELATSPAERNVKELKSYSDLLGAKDEVLTMVLEVSNLVYRAKVTTTMLPYTVVPSIDAIQGLEVICDGWKVDRRNHLASLQWAPKVTAPLKDAETIPWTLAIADAASDSLQVNVGIQTDASTMGVQADADLQTDPQMKVQLTRGKQLPLDVVFCIDSSASVDETDFQKATAFLGNAMQYFEMPSVQVGLIQFNDKVPFPCEAPITGDRQQLEQTIRELRFNNGETLLAPPILRAARMLEESSRRVQKSIVVITDGHPNDLDLLFGVVNQVEVRDHRLVFITIGPEDRSRIMQDFSSIVVNLQDFDALLESTESVLQSVLGVTQWVYRAKCQAPLVPYEVVDDIDAEDGLEIVCPGWKVRRDTMASAVLRWDPIRCAGLADFEPAPWTPDPAPLASKKAGFTLTTEVINVIPDEDEPEEPPEDPTPEPEPSDYAFDKGIQTETVESVQTAIQTICCPTTEASSQTGQETPKAAPARVPAPAAAPSPGPVPAPSPAPAPADISSSVGYNGISFQDAEVQSEPLVCAQLKLGRHLPMDVVFCLDSSISVCKHDDGVVDSTNFDKAKAFVKRFVEECDMPEFHFALIRFEDQSLVTSELTSSCAQFIERLKNTTSSLGETRMCTPLMQARDMLHGSAREVQKVVIVVTDGDPNDPVDTAGAVHALLTISTRLLFVKVGPKSSTESLRALVCSSSVQNDSGPEGHTQNTRESMVDVVEATDYEGLLSMVPEVMRRLVKVTRIVARARANIAMPPYEIVEELGHDSEGFDFDLTCRQVIDSHLMPWDESLPRIKPDATDMPEEVEDAPAEDAPNAPETLVDTEELQAELTRMRNAKKVQDAELLQMRKAKKAQDAELLQMREKLSMQDTMQLELVKLRDRVRELEAGADSGKSEEQRLHAQLAQAVSEVQRLKRQKGNEATPKNPAQGPQQGRLQWCAQATTGSELMMLRTEVIRLGHEIQRFSHQHIDTKMKAVVGSGLAEELSAIGVHIHKLTDTLAMHRSDQPMPEKPPTIEPPLKASMGLPPTPPEWGLPPTPPGMPLARDVVLPPLPGSSLVTVRDLLLHRYADMETAFFALGGDRSSRQIATTQLVAGLAEIGVDRLTSERMFGEIVPQKAGLDDHKREELTLEEWLRAMGQDSVEVEAEPPPKTSQSPGRYRHSEKAEIVVGTNVELNGHIATVMKFDDVTSSYVVAFADGAQKSVKAEELVPHTFTKSNLGESKEKQESEHGQTLPSAKPDPNCPPTVKLSRKNSEVDSGSPGSQDLETPKMTKDWAFERTPPVPPRLPDASSAAEILRDALKTTSRPGTPNRQAATKVDQDSALLSGRTNKSTESAGNFRGQLAFKMETLSSKTRKPIEGRKWSTASTGSDDPMQGLKDLHQTLQQRAAKISASIGSSKSKSPGTGTRKISNRSVAPM